MAKHNRCDARSCLVENELHGILARLKEDLKGVKEDIRALMKVVENIICKVKGLGQGMGYIRIKVKIT